MMCALSNLKIYGCMLLERFHAYMEHVCIYSLADLNAGRCVKLTFLDRKFSRCLMFMFLKCFVIHRCYMAKILTIRRKTLSYQSILAF